MDPYVHRLHAPPVTIEQVAPSELSSLVLLDPLLPDRVTDVHPDLNGQVHNIHFFCGPLPPRTVLRSKTNDPVFFCKKKQDCPFFWFLARLSHLCDQHVFWYIVPNTPDPCPSDLGPSASTSETVSQAIRSSSSPPGCLRLPCGLPFVLRV